MAAWGWLALLAVPGWLLWVTSLGYAMVKGCVEGDLTHDPANTDAAKQACHDHAPAAWAPLRGVRFGTTDLSAEYEVAGAVIALLFAALVVILARRSGARRAHR